MNTPKLTIKNGKFYRGKDEIAPEFGNTEQIALLKQSERLNEEYSSEDGVTYEPDFNVYEVVVATVEFNCVCGRTLEIEGQDGDEFGDGDREEAIRWMVQRKTKTCVCGKCYDISLDGEDVVIKFSKQQKSK